MALAASPARTAPQTRIAADRGSSLLDSSIGSPVITTPRACTRSAVRCGREVCPPGPCSRNSIRSAVDVMGPTRRPTWPTGTRGSQCRAKTRSTPSNAPAAITSRAPPGMTSSAGWKISRTRPVRPPHRCRASAAPSTAVVCTSCPQACMMPGTVEANGSPVSSSSGSASMSARRAMTGSPVPISATTPVPLGSRPALIPASVSTSRMAALVATSERESSGRACNRRRNRIRSGRASARCSSSHPGPWPAPGSATRTSLVSGASAMAVWVRGAAMGGAAILPKRRDGTVVRPPKDPRRREVPPSPARACTVGDLALSGVVRQVLVG